MNVNIRLHPFPKSDLDTRVCNRDFCFEIHIGVSLSTKEGYILSFVGMFSFHLMTFFASSDSRVVTVSDPSMYCLPLKQLSYCSLQNSSSNCWNNEVTCSLDCAWMPRDIKSKTVIIKDFTLTIVFGAFGNMVWQVNACHTFRLFVLFMESRFFRKVLPNVL